MIVDGYEIKPGTDLSEANLSEADLRWANLSEANLFRANLSGADLSGADLGNNNALIIPKSKNIKFNINIGRERTRIGCIDKLNTFWLEDSTELNELINENKITNVELYRNLIWYGIYRGSM